jgi:hypothetical protein
VTGTILNALVPILVTMAVGLLAAWRRQFGAQQASTINQMVMQYALPFSLFAGMLQASCKQPGAAAEPGTPVHSRTNQRYRPALATAPAVVRCRLLLGTQVSCQSR